MATVNLPELQYTYLDTNRVAIGAPAGEDNVGSLLRYWEASEGITDWQGLLDFVDAALGGSATGNFNDDWHTFWETA